MPAPLITILQLDTAFVRLPGDVAAPASYAVPPEIIRIPGAAVASVVTAEPEGVDLAPFIEAIAAARGDVITTSCGFLIYHQSRLAAAAHPKPFISSALTEIPRLAADHTPDEMLILTFDAASLTATPYRPMLGDFAPRIIGLGAQSHLADVIRNDRESIDAGRVGDEIIALLAPHMKGVRTLLMECGNLPPWRRAIRDAFKVEVVDILTCIERRVPGSVAADFI